MWAVKTNPVGSERIRQTYRFNDERGHQHYRLGYQGPRECHDALLEMQQGPGKIEYLMLGISCDHTFDRLVQTKLTASPTTDAAFFRLNVDETTGFMLISADTDADP